MYRATTLHFGYLIINNKFLALFDEGAEMTYFQGSVKMDSANLIDSNPLSSVIDPILSEEIPPSDSDTEEKIKSDNHNCAVSLSLELNKQENLNEDSERDEIHSEKILNINDLTVQVMEITDNLQNEELSNVNKTLCEPIIDISSGSLVSNEEKITSKETSDIQPMCDIKIDYNFNAVPFQITGGWETFSLRENYTKGCKWSPDGTCLLTNSNDQVLRLFNIPHQFYEEVLSFDSFTEMSPILSMRESELIYDYCWFPKMTSSDPDTCFLISCSASNPVHMWNAYTGKLHCTYRPYNNMDEVIPSYSLTFNQNGDKLYCGFNKMIKVFDVAIPGRDCISRPTNEKKNGQAGIISCIAVNPVDQSIYAAGSYSRTVGIYSEPNGKLMFMLQGHSGGLTHIQFSSNGNCLYSGGRKDPEILCWDLRNPGEVLFAMKREVVTNQRMYFDMDPNENYLVSGNNDGTISIWDTVSVPMKENEIEIVLEPILQFKGHNDTVNGVSFHPTLPVLASCSGQRKFPDPTLDSDTEDYYAETIFDNSLRLWWFGNNSFPM